MTDLSELLDHYFALGVAEGKEGRDHDTADGEAQATRDLIDMKIDRLSRAAEMERDKADPIAWESTGGGLTKYVTDARYRKFSPSIQRWYKPYRCSSCSGSPKPAAVSEGGEDE